MAALSWLRMVENSSAIMETQVLNPQHAENAAPPDSAAKPSHINAANTAISQNKRTSLAAQKHTGLRLTTFARMAPCFQQELPVLF